MGHKIPGTVSRVSFPYAFKVWLPLKWAYAPRHHQPVLFLNLKLQRPLFPIYLVLCSTTMQALLDATWVQMSVYLARSFRNLGIASAVPGQSVHGIIDCNALDNLLIGAITVVDLTPGTINQLMILNSVPHEGYSPIGAQTTAAGEKLRQLARAVRVSQIIAYERTPY